MGNKILIIDDDTLVLKTVSKLLDDKGYEVVACGNGGDAIKVFQDQKFDLVISDIRMEGQDGIETVRKIRDIEQERNHTPLPIIMMTAYAQDNGSDEASKIGVQDVIHKPFERRVLIDSVQKHIASVRSQ